MSTACECAPAPPRPTKDRVFADDLSCICLFRRDQLAEGYLSREIVDMDIGRLR